ncbi:MAG TPA: glycoside hydrolase family 57 protein [Deltaproteobacteria bacterium]|nr:glycoside hydrolase family 57 protein [Deltaproteobacteria bacterium]
MKDVAVGFLWHMHQPYYKDPVSGTYLMPWVRLHAIRGYYDMIALLDDYPGIRCTFNLVPSLLAQILDYTDGGLRDLDFYLSQKRPSDLTNDEKNHIVSRFFMCNEQTMITPFPRYTQLFEKRGVIRKPKELDEITKKFNSQDILDLQVLFNLTWTGFTMRKDKGIRDLIKKGRSYTESEKRYLLDLQIKIMEMIIPHYKESCKAGRIEITTSPFYHPIGPLVMNVGYALRSLDTPLPKEAFSHPEDLNAQITKAMSFHEKLFGSSPKGMWPSEGSVCPEMIDLLAQNGIEWAASDEAILFASLKQSRTGARLYKPYQVSSANGDVSMFFRDRPLSDHIGFMYAKNPSDQAADNLMYHLNNIRKGSKSFDFNPFVSIILDGENPWEYYPDSGEQFLRRLYGQLESTQGIKTSLFHDFLQGNPVKESIANLYTGSWINHNFAIWIGHEEERKAWEYLSRTRSYVEAKGNDADPLAWEEIYIAEGSDWFWWYGDDFVSENDEQFDSLFRLHLTNCYTLHDETPPAELSQSIITPHDIIPEKMPVGFIHPKIDGRVTHFYEWLKAGYYSAVVSSTSMYRHQLLLSQLFFGFDEEHLYVRMDFRDLPDKVTVRLDILSPEPVRLSIPPSRGPVNLFMFENNVYEKKAELESVAFEEILEFKVPFTLLGVVPKQRIRFFLSLRENELELERHPSNGLLSLIIPENDYEKVMWYV